MELIKPIVVMSKSCAEIGGLELHARKMNNPDASSDCFKNL